MSVVFITGASRGIGAATVDKFTKEGWKVAGFYNKNKVSDTSNVKYYHLDVSDEKQIVNVFQQAVTELGGVSCLVNNAGMFGGKKNLKDYSEGEMDKIISVNEKGVYFCTKAILEHMSEGSIVNVSSTVAQIGGSDPMYTATKAAVLGFTKSMAKSLAPKIRVNAVAPGATNTDMMRDYDPARKQQLVDLTLLKRMAQPEDIANGIYFLASDDARHITGTCLDISGGYVIR